MVDEFEEFEHLLPSEADEVTELPDGWADYTDETVTDDLIRDWKKSGVDRPPGVTYARWAQPREMSPRMHAVAQMHLFGDGNSVISKELGISANQVSRIMAMPMVKKHVEELRAKYFGDGRSKMKALMGKSFMVLEQILDDVEEKSSIRLEAAKYVIDQTVGKAQQNLKVEGTILVDILAKLDSQTIRDATEATSKNLIEAPKDEMDNFLDTVITENIVVGRRSEL